MYKEIINFKVSEDFNFFIKKSNISVDAEIKDINSLIDFKINILKKNNPEKLSKIKKNYYFIIQSSYGGKDANQCAYMIHIMYNNFFKKNFKNYKIIEINDINENFRSSVFEINDEKLSILLFQEQGIYKIIRKSKFNKDNKRQTSFVNIYITEKETNANISIPRNDLKIESCRSSGAGGQHVNTTDSAVRVTHIPTGIVINIQNQRSYHDNLAFALNLIQEKVYYYKKIQELNEKNKKFENIQNYNIIRVLTFDKNIYKDYILNTEINSKFFLELLLNGEYLLNIFNLNLNNLIK